MKNKLMFVVVLLLCLNVTACSKPSAEPVNQDNLVKKNSDVALSATPSVLEDISKDDSIRAIGTHPDGRLLVKPISKVNQEQLGAPSCFGLETDSRWSGRYELVWESAEGTSSQVMEFPQDLEIIQPDAAPIEMEKYTFGDTDVFAFMPRYRDCHALEVFLFGVEEGEAFSIPFQMKPEQTWSSIGQLPSCPLQQMDNQLVVTSGYGAAQDHTNVYYFRYESNKRSMVLQKTENIEVNDLTCKK